MSRLKLIVAGAAGRMGEAILNEAERAADLTIAAALERPGHAAIGRKAAGVTITDRLDPFVSGGGVLVEFTTPAATLLAARRWAGAGLAMVIGTTGFSAAEEAEIAALSRRAAIVKSGNFSLGVALLAALARKAAGVLGADYDIEIVEAHHRAKVDAPSGTALLLARAAADGRGLSLDAALTTSRDGARADGAIGVASIRGGGIVGDHEVMFAGPAEVITLAHRALDRSLFARGAIVAARWVADRPPGLYSMADVLGL